MTEGDIGRERGDQVSSIDVIDVGSKGDVKICEDGTKIQKSIVDMDTQATQKRLKAIYNVIRHNSDLFYGVDKDIDDVIIEDGNRKDRNEDYDSSVPDSVSAGYGEISQGSFSRIIAALRGEK